VVQSITGDYPAAAQAQEQALGLYRDLGDRLGQASVLNDLGVVRRLTVTTQPRPRPTSKPWTSTVTWVTGSARPVSSTHSGSCGG
jgi:hypothetical protein